MGPQQKQTAQVWTLSWSSIQMRKVHLGLVDLGVSVSSLVTRLSFLVSPHILTWPDLLLICFDWLLLKVLLLVMLVKKPWRRVLEEHRSLEEGARLKIDRLGHFSKLKAETSHLHRRKPSTLSIFGVNPDSKGVINPKTVATQDKENFSNKQTNTPVQGNNIWAEK